MKYIREKIRGIRGIRGKRKIIEIIETRGLTRKERGKGKERKGKAGSAKRKDGAERVSMVVVWLGTETLETTLDTRPYQQVLVYDAAAETVGIDIDSDAI